jgi:signal transduction histidine kinase
MEERRTPGPERRDILRLILFRVVIFTSLFISAVIIQFSTDTFLPLVTFYYLIILSYVLCLIYFFVYYFWKRNFNVQVYLQIFFDLLLITALVHISGGIKGTFYFLYIFEIIAASIVLSSRAAYVTAGLSAVFFGLLLEGMYYRFIPNYGPEQTMEISLGAVTNNIFVSWLVFFLIAFLINSLTGSLRKTRERLRLMQKGLEIRNRLAAAGEVSAQLAHEIRNPLAAISGSIQVLKGDLKLGSEQKDLMKIVVKESERVSKSIEQFLNLASPGKQTRSPIDLSAVLRETLILFQKSGEYNGDWRIKGNYKSSSVPYFGDASQFRQIFWNLIKNALKAMPRGGTLRIDFRKTKENKVEIRFADTGIGMTKEERERIFEPFYSGFENGTGIGMAVVRGIVDEYNGKIEVESEPDKGTEIVVILPERRIRKQDR